MLILAACSTFAAPPFRYDFEDIGISRLRGQFYEQSGSPYLSRYDVLESRAPPGTIRVRAPYYPPIQPQPPVVSQPASALPPAVEIEDESEDVGKACSICLEDFAPGDSVQPLGCEKHKIHVSCMESFREHSTSNGRRIRCPICRHN